ncbi:hypothetical protein SKAU_G00344770 [Synaphobranchus kaupii]|uniref:C2H2-type domain-containing protein n=1 Tax=Synaphobranchus kaupii TaxID=118154 RepID=A0A9Q1EJ84_SYNKA|nr:hypothetical protein SKAU_G00344770 [Synaphobranchus kaupii]
MPVLKKPLKFIEEEKAKIASIMEVLANAAVAEICKLVDDGYAVLRLEMSHSQKENESLRKKLQVLEFRVAQACNFTERTRTKASSVNNRPNGGSVFDKFRGSTTAEPDSIQNTGLIGDGEPAAEDQEESVMNGNSCVEPGAGRTEALLIKEESVEEGEVNTREERLVVLSDDDDKMAAALGNQTPPSKGREAPTDRQRTRRHVWESADVEEKGSESLPVKEERLREEVPRSETQGGSGSSGETFSPGPHSEELTEQHGDTGSLWEVQGFKTAGVLKAKKRRGTERRAPGLNRLDSEFVMFERPGQLGSYCTQGGAVTETEDPCCSYSTETDPQSLSFHPELQRGPAGKSLPSLPSLGHLGWNPVGAESAPIKMDAELRSTWNRRVVSRTLHMQPESDHDDREGEKFQTDDVSDVCPPFSQMGGRVGGAREEGVADTADLNGCGLLEKSFAVSETLRLEAGSGGLYGNGGEIGEFGQVLLNEERQFSCAQCGKLFAHPGRLKVHQRVHTGEKPFSCAQCGKRFAQSSHIKRHQRVHTGEKPFSCTQCGKSFSHLCNLKTHQTVHTGERPYSCTQCGKNFSSLGNLIRHQSVHIGK